MAETQRPPSTHRGDVEAAIEAVERLDNYSLIGAKKFDERLALAVLPSGKSITNLSPMLDALLDAPRRIETTAHLTAVSSLIDYINRFKITDSVIFAKDDPAKPSLIGVIDFHGGPTDPDDDGPCDDTPGSNARPRFGRHCARYEFPLSEQIKAWSGISGKPLDHTTMAAFLDERRYDIVNPPADWMLLAESDRPTVDLILHLLNIGSDQGEVDDHSADVEPGDDDDRYIPRSALYKLRQIRFGSVHRLLQMARMIEVSVGRKAREGYDNKTGQRTVSFEEEHQTQDKAGRRIVVPDFFLLNVPIFDGETRQLIPVRLQYRHAGVAGLVWFMTLVEWQRVVRFAVRTEAERAARETELPLYYGQRGAS